jgi:hypothetical protein
MGEPIAQHIEAETKNKAAPRSKYQSEFEICNILLGFSWHKYIIENAIMGYTFPA